MPRIRSTKPEFWIDRKLAQRTSRDTRMLYMGMWNLADEHARLIGDAQYLKGQLFPYDDDITPDTIELSLKELEACGCIEPYFDTESDRYLFLPKLGKHQRLEPTKVPSKHPAPPDPNEPARRADLSARDSDESAQTSLPQVSPGLDSGADESARDADQSSLLYAAGSLEPGLKAAAAAGFLNEFQMPDELVILRSKMLASTVLSAMRWDRLTPEAAETIKTLIEIHGDKALIDRALKTTRADEPPVFVQFYLQTWCAMPAPGQILAAVLTPCPNREHIGFNLPCSACAADSKAAAS